MRLELATANRLGITHEVLGVLRAHRLDLRALEVETHRIALDLPGLEPEGLPALARALAAVPGVRSVAPLALLPGERRRLLLDALLDAIGDPVLAVDADGAVPFANAAARALLPGGSDPPSVDRLLEPADLLPELRARGFAMADREVRLAGRTFLLEGRPLGGGEDRSAAGALLVLHAPARLGARLAALSAPGPAGFEALVGSSPAFLRLKARAARLAALDAPLLIRGETGTGKELLARACHAASRRAAAPFLALNCAALPESLAESELFGYAPGAFSGAQRQGKPGLLELADTGTVFLDEIGELSPYLQAKLLRFLQDGSFRRVGGTVEERVDVRVVSATHRDLEAMVAAGRFREDLWYRLAVLTLELPPLRARREDLPELVAHFLTRAAAQVGRPVPRLAPEALAALARAELPGNVRELESLLFRAVALADGPEIDVEDLDPARPRAAADPAGTSPATLAQAVAAFEAELLRRLWAEHPSTRRLARRLGTAHTTIAQKLRRYGIGAGRPA
jgi:TyrR family helix-turn-helix protein